MTLDDLGLENNLYSSFRRQYLANSTHRCRALTSASARLSCVRRQNAPQNAPNHILILFTDHKVGQRTFSDDQRKPIQIQPAGAKTATENTVQLWYDMVYSMMMMMMMMMMNKFLLSWHEDDEVKDT